MNHTEPRAHVGDCRWLPFGIETHSSIVSAHRSLITKYQIREFCRFAYIADKEARSDLVSGWIRDEDDYTSNFTGALRRIINSNSRSGLTATSFLLKPNLERAMGCDATIIIASQTEMKIAVFEAKLPRLSKPTAQWDRPQTSAGLSHFSDQLDRQKAFKADFAIFEMFYCDLPFGQQPQYMKNEVSSCVWHDNAVQFDSTRSGARPPWTRADLVQLLQLGNIDISGVLKSLCSCSVGKPIPAPRAGAEAMISDFHLSGHVLFVRAEGVPKQFEG